MKSYKVEILEWDTDFFGYKVGRIFLSKDDKDLSGLPELLLEGRRSGFKLIYLFSDNKIDQIKINNEFYTGFLADKKITFLKEADNKNKKTDPSIIRYFSKDPHKELKELAIQSGEFSRFKIDKNISDDKFKHLYELWIENIIKNDEDKIFIYYDKTISGFITLGERNKKADIGLIAVDYKKRGLGIGTKLLEFANNWAFEKGYETIQVVTQKKNVNACNFYKSNGFEVEKLIYVYHLWQV